MPDRTIGNDDTAIAARALSAHLRAWGPSDEDVAWLLEQITLRADDWAALALVIADDEESALCFDPQWHD